MNKPLLVVAVIVIAAVFIGGGWWMMDNNTQVLNGQNTNTQGNTNTDTTNADTANTDNGQNITIGGNLGADVIISQMYTVTYTDSGYAPGELKIKAGDTVVFKNQSSGDLWTGSAMHPGHVNYSGTTLQSHCPDPENDDFDQCKGEGAGTLWSFTFTKTGAFGYHNHLKSNEFGKIVVE